MTVLLGNINPGVVSSDFMRSVMGFMAYDSENRAVLKGYLPWLSSACVDLYRNMICESFLQSDYEWLWFVDSDIEVYNNTLYDMLDVADPSTRPVVTGIYMTLTPEGKQAPCLHHRGIEPTQQKMSMIQYEEVPETDEVDGCGAGCLLIHRSLLDAMRKLYPPQKPWFDMGIFDDVPYGEDFTFCMRVKQMGFPITVCHTATVGHQKHVKLTVPIGETANA